MNRTPSRVLNGKTPYEALFHSTTSYDRIRVFGCLCYAYNLQRRKDKFGKRSKRCIFVGYPHGKKGSKVYDIETGEIFVSRDVIFHEDVSPLATSRPADTTHFGSTEQPTEWSPIEEERWIGHMNKRVVRPSRNEEDTPSGPSNEVQRGPEGMGRPTPDPASPSNRVGPRTVTADQPQHQPSSVDRGSDAGLGPVEGLRPNEALSSADRAQHPETGPGRHHESGPNSRGSRVC